MQSTSEQLTKHAAFDQTRAHMVKCTARLINSELLHSNLLQSRKCTTDLAIDTKQEHDMALQLYLG